MGSLQTGVWVKSKKMEIIASLWALGSGRTILRFALRSFDDLMWYLLQQLSAIHEEYHRVKSGLSAYTSSGQQSLNVIENGLVQIVTKFVIYCCLSLAFLL